MLPSRDGALDTGTEDVAAEQHPDVLIRNLVELVQVLVDGRGEAGCASHGLMLLGANMVNIVEMDDVDILFLRVPRGRKTEFGESDRGVTHSLF